MILNLVVLTIGKSFKSVLVEIDNSTTMLQTIYRSVYDVVINDV